ncbi:metal ABC transporter permease [Calderihabitans maritimus]|uniref:ABC transporter n=1 Tax=Calderihabitans maritimus TaxID=1246530 RepID=A0A1Z5HYK0_9FIRM|nr:metal ABC transporter permease [Calderihabitans maritimus]GAW94385.1 ABC transporter [Calderihabitans maritimus]
MPEILQYGFMQRALLTGIIIAVVCPTIGLFLVLRRLSMIGDTLAHVSLAGVALGLVTGLNVLLSSLIFTGLAALGLEKLRRAYHQYAEIAAAIMLSFGVSLAIILVGLGRGDTSGLFAYLFGSLVAISPTDLVLIAAIGLVVMLVVVWLYRELFYISFDEEGARLAGVPVGAVNLVFMFLAALTVTVSMRMVGVLLISSLMVLPVATSLQLAGSFRQAHLGAVAVALFSVIAGLFLAYYLDTPPGGTIIMVSVFLLVLALAGKNVLSSGQQEDGLSVDPGVDA